MANNASYASAAKPNVAGAIYRAAKTATLPTTADGTLSADYKCLGYISEDGVTNSNSRSSDTFKAWGGDTILTNQTEYTDTFNFKLLEVLNADVLGTVYGEANVTGSSLATGISVQANSQELSNYIWVIDMIMNGDTLNRIVIPDGKISEVGDTVYSGSDLVAYDVTVSAFPDSSGNTHYEYKKTKPVVS
jgi:hypothetical protein